MQQAKSTVAQAGAVAGAAVGAYSAAAGASGGGKLGKMSALAKTPAIMAKAGLQNAMAKNPFTQGYASGVKGVLGSDGSIRGKGAAENVGFMQGVRKLAGLEISSSDKAKPTQSLNDIARHGPRKDNDTSVKGHPPIDRTTGKPMPSSSFRHAPGVGHKIARPPGFGGGNGGGSGNNPTHTVVSQPGMSKSTEKTKESTFRQESVHTANEKNIQTPTPGSGSNATTSSGTSNTVSGMQNNITSNTTNNQATTKNSSSTTNVSSNNSSGNNPGGNMSNLGNFGKK